MDEFNYAEVNRGRDAMAGQPRVTNRVLPEVTNLDCVSWSSYDGQDLPAGEIRRTLDYLEAMLPASKAAAIPGKRVFVGEYGWGHLVRPRKSGEPVPISAPSWTGVARSPFTGRST